MLESGQASADIIRLIESAQGASGNAVLAACKRQHASSRASSCMHASAAHVSMSQEVQCKRNRSTRGEYEAQQPRRLAADTKEPQRSVEALARDM